MSTGTVYLVDDDASVLKALSRLLREAGYYVSAFQSAADFILQYDGELPGCVILDVALGDWNGIDLQQTISKGGFAHPTIFITGGGDVPTGVRAMKLGAIDFLTKPVHETQLIEAIQKALERDARGRTERATVDEIATRMATLTHREREVLRSVITGRLNKQIAGDLDISEKTVKVHRARALRKMAVRSVPELVRNVALLDRATDHEGTFS